MSNEDLKKLFMVAGAALAFVFLLAVFVNSCGVEQPPFDDEVRERAEEQADTEAAEAEEAEERLGPPAGERGMSPSEPDTLEKAQETEAEAREKRRELEREQLDREADRLIDEFNAEFEAWQSVPFTGMCAEERESALSELGEVIGEIQASLRDGRRETIRQAGGELENIRTARALGPTGIYEKEAFCGPTIFLEYGW